MFKKSQTVDSILSTFNVMVSDLNALIVAKDKERDEIEIKLKELKDEHAAVSAEATRAEIVLNKIKNFIGGENA